MFLFDELVSQVSHRQISLLPPPATRLHCLLSQDTLDPGPNHDFPLLQKRRQVIKPPIFIELFPEPVIAPEQLPNLIHEVSPLHLTKLLQNLRMSGSNGLCPFLCIEVDLALLGEQLLD